MAKEGMRRYLPGDIHGGRNHNDDPRVKDRDNEVPTVPEIKGKAKKGKEKAEPLDR